MTTDADLWETNTHSFIVRVWLEDAAAEHGALHWRGHVTHVPSGERRYFETLTDIIDFIGSYFKEWGAIQ